MHKILISILVFLTQTFSTENLKDKIIDTTLSVSAGMSVYFNIPLQISPNFYIQEVFKSVLSIITAVIIVILTLLIRREWRGKDI
jgi:hypothetical protein